MAATLDFGLDRVDAPIFIRYQGINPSFTLFSRGEVIGTVSRLLLHIDLPTAIDDRSTGPAARGTGVVRFPTPPARGPMVIVDRDISTTAWPSEIGFVFDVASPYPVKHLNLTGIRRHQLCSTFPGIRHSMADAYEQYENFFGARGPAGSRRIPVYDVHGWINVSRREGKNVMPCYRPRFKLCGFVDGLETPLTDELVAAIDRRRDFAMIDSSRIKNIVDPLNT